MKIPYGRQWIDDDDIARVVEVLKGDWLTSGPTVERFEEALADMVGAKYAVSFSSGTAALHGAAHASGLGAGETLATSPLTFMASANCGRYVGANVALVDIDEATLNIDLSLVQENVDALVPVDYAGLPVDLRNLERRPRIVIQDAAHTLGARHPDGFVGDCLLSDMTSFSFHPVKPITTAEGGAVTTNSSDLAEKLRRFRNHGIERQPDVAPWYYSIDSLGFNYRLTDVQAALGLAQLERLGAFIDRRNEIADRYRAELNSTAIVLPPAAEDGFLHGYHLFVVKVPHRREVLEGLHAAGIGVQVHYVPVHHHPISEDVALPTNGLPVCDRVYEQIISLPIFPAMTKDEQLYVIEHLKSLVKG